MTQTKERKHAISPTRSENFPEWYQQVLKAADLAENSPVRGCMVIKPWGYGIWENIQRQLDAKIKETGHQNAYFPLFIPLSFLEKEASHVEGFAKECAVITHHRLEERDGKLIPSGELEEPLIVRPTSETIIGHSFSKWVESYRDLPLLINQWANVVRWEMRTRIFLRTTEFLWQEGHTVHATEKEAVGETLKMLEVYRSFAENVLALPVIIGEKSAGERFPGAVSTYTLEAMMQDGKALQIGTSHYLGQNFAKANEIRFSNIDGELEYGYTTSWGVTTRLIGALIMTHSDDDGLRLPPRVASKQVVILPIAPKPEHQESVDAFCKKIEELLRQQNYHGAPLECFIDRRDMRGGEKNWEWIKKGVPLRIEVGPRDVEKGVATIARRDRSPSEKEQVPLSSLADFVIPHLDEIQEGYFKSARAFRDAHLVTLNNFDELRDYFTEEREGLSGFVKAKWCGDPATEEQLKDLKATIRVLPMKQSGTEGSCILTGRPAKLDIIIAKAY